LIAISATWPSPCSNPSAANLNIIGLGYSAYQGSRNMAALYAEVLAPVLKGLELSGALHHRPARHVCARLSRPERGRKRGGRAGRVFQRQRPGAHALGVEAACDPAAVAIITSPNPALEPEKLKSMNPGVIWDPLSRTSVSLDVWQIKRKNEIDQEQSDAAIAAGHVARDAIPAWPALLGRHLAHRPEIGDAQ